MIGWYDVEVCLAGTDECMYDVLWRMWQTGFDSARGGGRGSRRPQFPGDPMDGSGFVRSWLGTARTRSTQVPDQGTPWMVLALSSSQALTLAPARLVMINE